MLVAATGLARLLVGPRGAGAVRTVALAVVVAIGHAIERRRRRVRLDGWRYDDARREKYERGKIEEEHGRTRRDP